MTRRAEAGVWVVTIACVCIAVAGWRSAVPIGRHSSMFIAASPDTPDKGSPDRVEALASRIVSHNPFRVDRKPAAVAFSAGAPAPQGFRLAVRPPLQVSGVFGPPWQAVMEGVPGREGSVVVRVGDAFGDLRIRSIRKDTVVVESADTTWKLTVRRMW